MDSTLNVAQYGIMNVSRPNREVILRKIDDAFNTLTGGSFVLMRWDHTTVSSGGAGTAGCIFAGDLPLGTYYLHETALPTGITTDSTGEGGDGTWWYVLKVSASGVSITKYATQEGAEAYAATLTANS